MDSRRRNLHKKQFKKGGFKLPKTSRMLAEGYNFTPKKNNKPVNWRNRILLAAFILIIVFIYSPIFRIKNVIVNGVESKSTQKYIADTLEEFLGQSKFYILPQNNLLLFSPDAALEYLNTKILVDNAKFDRQLPNVLRMQIDEKVIIGLLEADSSLYSLDKRGYVIQPIEFATNEPSFVIIKSTKSKPELNTEVMSADVASKLEYLQEKWSEVIKAPLANIVFNETKLPTIELVTKEGWRVYMSLYENIDIQVSVLNDLIAGKLKDDLPKVDYIEVRFGNKIYYLLK